MSYTTVKAKSGQTCIRCGRTFPKGEFVFQDGDGDLICLELCFRIKPAKVILFRPRESAINRQPHKSALLSRKPEEPVTEREPANEGHDGGLMSDILKKEIEDFARKLKEDK